MIPVKVVSSERSVARGVTRLWQALYGQHPLFPTMFRTLVEPALRDVARDVEDEVFPLVEKLAQAYGTAAIALRDARAREVDELHQRALDVEAIMALVHQLAELQRQKAELHGELSETLGELHEARELCEDLDAAVSEAQELERTRCVHDVCELCRQGRAPIRVELHTLSQADGYRVTHLWVHPDPETAPFQECKAGPIRERARG